MIVPDVNLLIHAYNPRSSDHPRARAWLEFVLGDARTIGWTWVTLLGFIRISTQPRIMGRPLTVHQACDHVRSWLAQPYALVLEPGRRHPEILFGLLESIGAAGDPTTDAHLAALAIDHQAELHSTDADFARFPGLKWHNPLRSS